MPRVIFTCAATPCFYLLAKIYLITSVIRASFSVIIMHINVIGNITVLPLSRVLQHNVKARKEILISHSFGLILEFI